MPRVTCRCGEKLKVPPGSPERIDCPRCSAKIRLRPPVANDKPFTVGDGFVRFHCQCGRRLKVASAGRPTAGKCPDCGRVVPVPDVALSQTNAPSGAIFGDPEAPTEELDAHDLAALEKWAGPFRARSQSGASTRDAVPKPNAFLPGTDPAIDLELIPPADSPSAVRFEAGMRVCPNCRKPVHLGAEKCRGCGTLVPRQ
jgi:hypothetical protein